MNKDDQGKRYAVLSLNHKLLAQILKLPKDIEIMYSRQSNYYGAVDLFMSGDSLPEECLFKDGEEVTKVDVNYVTENGQPQFDGFTAKKY